MFEVLRSYFKQPLWLDSHNFSHVLFGSHNKLVVNDPLWVAFKHSRTGMNVDLLVISDGLIALYLVSPTGMVEEASSNCLSDGIGLISTNVTSKASLNGLYWKAELVHDLNELVLGVLGPFKTPSLHKVLETPRNRAVVLLPLVVDGQQSQVITVLRVELGLSLVSSLLLVSWSVEHVLNLEH